MRIKLIVVVVVLDVFSPGDASFVKLKATLRPGGRISQLKLITFCDNCENAQAKKPTVRPMSYF